MRRRAEAIELDLEAVVAGRRGRQEAVRQRPAVEKRERDELAPQRRGQRAHRPDPPVLERVVLRLGEHVQAQDGLEERRVAEGERRRRAPRRVRSESRSPTIGRAARHVKHDRFDLLLANQLTGRARASTLWAVRRILLLCLLPLALGAAPRASGDTTLLIGTVGPGVHDRPRGRERQARRRVDRGPLPAPRPRPRRTFTTSCSATRRPARGSRRRRSRSSDDQTFDINLAPGQYVYACSPHFETMFGRLQVVSAPVATPPVAKLSAKVVPECGLDQRQERRRRAPTS